MACRLSARWGSFDPGALAGTASYSAAPSHCVGRRISRAAWSDSFTRYFKVTVTSGTRCRGLRRVQRGTGTYASAAGPAAVSRGRPDGAVRAGSEGLCSGRSLGPTCQTGASEPGTCRSDKHLVRGNAPERSRASRPRRINQRTHHLLGCSPGPEGISWHCYPGPHTEAPASVSAGAALS